MAKPERLPDRGDGRTLRTAALCESVPLCERCRHHPDGVYGFSVQGRRRLTVEQLATACSNKSVGFTTVAEIRIMGYE